MEVNSKEQMEQKKGALTEEKKQQENAAAKKRWFGKGVYGSKDVPIKILDGMIIFFVAAIIVMVVVFAVNGGYYVSFDTDGGSAVEEQKLRYGDYAKSPETPMKPGYVFVHWVTSEDEYLAEVWDFSEKKVEGDMTLYAVWEPAEIIVKLDLNGGEFSDAGTSYEKKVIFGEAYGELPVPEKDGYVFDGWVYSQQIIDESMEVFMTGEHILTARWIPE